MLPPEFPSHGQIAIGPVAGLRKRIENGLPRLFPSHFDLRGIESGFEKVIRKESITDFCRLHVISLLSKGHGGCAEGAIHGGAQIRIIRIGYFDALFRFHLLGEAGALVKVFNILLPVEPIQLFHPAFPQHSVFVPLSRREQRQMRKHM